MRGRWFRAALCALAMAGCGGGGGSSPPDAPPPDSVAVDAATTDAAGAAKEVREIVSGGARLTGGNFTLDVEVGHGVGQQKMTGGTLSVEGGAAVKP